ncbi:ABC transporter permease [Peptostreptococcus faecalis]|uniref:ABC transporter permease n=1 Tax=Peptostreptococcus faecalis TaxID=2045015 RepID=UPI000C7DDD45|nr:ABC transporter permease [Peptostreptococcus faecalis]
MINLMKCEVLKARKSLPIKILTILIIVLSVAMAFSHLNYVGSPYVKELNIPLEGYNTFFSSMNDSATIELLGIMIASILVCTDFENRTIQSEISAGYSRLQILLSKVIVFGITFFFVYLPIPLLRATIQGLLYKFGREMTMETITHMALSFGVVILIGIAINTMTILLAFIIKKSVITIGASIVIITLVGNAFLSFGSVSDDFRGFLSKTPIGLSKYIAEGQYNSDVLFTATIISIASIVFMIILTYVIFRKLDLK